jgi:RsiW-degrading membrane proteinase PrsW (M82 family)
MNFYSLTSLSLFGGLLPALLWLIFWLREDKLHPEPRYRIALSFVAGMLAVIAVIPVEKAMHSFMGGAITFTTLALWAAAEEIFKLAAAYFSALRYSANDEPIDPVIYLISAALGFSALENAFFLANFLNDGYTIQSLISGNMRFIGATILHTVSSAAVGIFLGLSYYKSSNLRKNYLLTGVILSIVLHTIFNSLIIKSGQSAFAAFGSVWIAAIVLILAFEKLKTIKKIHLD